MPVRSFALLICAVLVAASVTIAVAFAVSSQFSALAGSTVALALLVAAALVRQVGR